mmetsp:Transcript_21179/g.39783  ORF Transcript_21179/g.39783 Transcript_21179/m.39783 type:complete len:213 (-) Transcript_21179:1072-1710(-)
MSSKVSMLSLAEGRRRSNPMLVFKSTKWTHTGIINPTQARRIGTPYFGCRSTLAILYQNDLYMSSESILLYLSIELWGSNPLSSLSSPSFFSFSISLLTIVPTPLVVPSSAQHTLAHPLPGLKSLSPKPVYNIAGVKVKFTPRATSILTVAPTPTLLNISIGKNSIPQKHTHNVLPLATIVCPACSTIFLTLSCVVLPMLISSCTLLKRNRL